MHENERSRLGQLIIRSTCVVEDPWHNLDRREQGLRPTAEPTAAPTAPAEAANVDLAYGACRMVVSSRLHAVLLALLSGVLNSLTRFTAAATDLDYSGHIVKRATERVVARRIHVDHHRFHDRMHRLADHVDRRATGVPGETGVQPGPAHHVVGLLAGLRDAAADELLDRVGGDAGPLDHLGLRRTQELGRVQAGQSAVALADRRPGRFDDDGLSHAQLRSRGL